MQVSKVRHIERIFICFLLLSIFVTGCHSQHSDLGDHYVEGQDHQFMYQTGAPITMAAESADGYYFLISHFLYYMDKSTMEPVVLCGRPDCLHDQEKDDTRIWQCDGYFFQTSPRFLAWWNDNLYVYVTKDQEANQLGMGALVRVAPDGSQREEVFRFSEEPGQMAIHRGTLYYASALYDLGLNANYCIRSVDISGGQAKEKLLFEGKRESGSIQKLWCYGNRLYFREDYMENGRMYFEWKQIDLLTEEVKSIGRDRDIMGVQPDGLVTLLINEDSSEEGQSCKTGFNGENEEKWISLNQDQRYYSDGNRSYLYTPFTWMEDQPVTLKEIDQEGNTIVEMELDTVEGMYEAFIPGGKGWLFFSALDDNYQYHLYGINKEEFSNGNKNIKELLMIEELSNSASYG